MIRSQLCPTDSVNRNSAIPFFPLLSEKSKSLQPHSISPASLDRPLASRCSRAPTASNTAGSSASPLTPRTLSSASPPRDTQGPSDPYHGCRVARRRWFCVSLIFVVGSVLAPMGQYLHGLLDALAVLMCPRATSAYNIFHSPLLKMYSKRSQP